MTLMNSDYVFECLQIKNNESKKKLSISEVEEYFINFINEWNPNKGGIVKYLVSRYKEKYPKELRRILLNYISLLLTTPDLVNQDYLYIRRGPLILIDMIIENQSKFSDDSFDQFLDEFIETVDLEPIFIPIFYEISFIASQKNITEDFMKYLSIVKRLIMSRRIRDLFIKEELWGLCDVKNARRIYASYNYATDELTNKKLDFLLPKKRAFFLDGFLEIFLYGPGDLFDPASLFLDKNMSDIRILNIEITKKMGDLAFDIYNIIHTLVSHSKCIKHNFLKYLIMTYKNNIDRKKIVYENTISDGYAFNLNVVLFLFFKKIDESRINLINPNFLHFLEEIESIDGCKDKFFVYENKEIKTRNPANPDYDEKLFSVDSFCTVIFCMKLNFLGFSYHKFLAHYQRLERELSALDELDDERSNKLKKIIKSKYLALKTVLLNQNLYKDELKFLNFLTKFILIHDPLKFSDYHFSVLFEMMEFIIQVYAVPINNDFLKLMSYLIKLNIKNVHFKSYIVRILFLKNERITTTIFNSLIQYYIDLEKIDSSFYDKYNIRWCINKIFKSDPNKHIVYIDNNKVNIRFLNFLLNDFEYLLSLGLTSIINIKINRKKIENQDENIREIQENLIRDEKNATVAFQCVDDTFQLLYLMINNKIFKSPEISSKFISILNCNLKTIVGPKCNALNVKDMAKYNFRPKELLRKIVLLYLNLSEDLYEIIVSDNLYFNINLFNRALEITRDKFILNDEQLENLSKLIEKLKNISQDQVKDEIQYPEEFIDPLTYSCMDDPIKLLTSNAVIDRSTYELIMIGDRIDPFSRMELDDTKIIPDKELKERIEKFKKENGINGS